MALSPGVGVQTSPRAVGRLRELGLAALASIALASFFLLIAAWHGALGASRNDDWVYYRSTFEFAAIHYFDPDPFTDTMMIGQTLASQPIFALFGRDLAAYQIAVGVIAAASLFAAFAFLRNFLRPIHAAIATGCMALGPIFGSVSTTFMTDVPSFALQAACLLLGARAIRDRTPHLGWMAATLAMGLAAFTFREYSAAAPLAMVLIALVKLKDSPQRARWAAAVMSGLWFVLTVALYIWRKSLNVADGRTISLDFVPDAYDAVQVAGLVFTISFLMSPVLAVISPKTVAQAWSRHRWVCAGLLIAVSGAWIHLWRGDKVFLGNYLQQLAPYSETIPGVGPTVVPDAVWIVVELIGWLSAAVLSSLAVYCLGLALRKRPLRHVLNTPERSTATLALLFSTMLIGLLVATNVLGMVVPLFDRYVLPVVPILGGWLLYAFGPRGAPRRPVARGLAALGAYSVLGLVIVDASATLDGAKWRTAQAVQAKGYSAHVINGGYEWFGLHQPTEIVRRDSIGPDWVGLFANPVVCATVSLPDGAPRRHAENDPTLIDAYTGRSALGLPFPLEARRSTGACGEAARP